MKQYISKDALIREIEKQRNVYINEPSKYKVLSRILSFINTFEVKDIDFNEEYIEEIKSHINGIRDKVDRMTSGNFMHSKAAIRFSANTIENVLKLMGVIKKGE